MKPIGLMFGAFILVVFAAWLVIGAGQKTQLQPAGENATTSAGGAATTPEAWECNGDGFTCPDGTTVGRTGPSCEFAACPPADRAQAQVTTYLGGTATAMNISVNPKEIISDSRCAEGVQCIWAGTVEVRTVIHSQMAHGEHTLTLGTAQVFDTYTVTLTQVSPYPKAGEQIGQGDYRFTFAIEKSSKKQEQN